MCKSQELVFHFNQSCPCLFFLNFHKFKINIKHDLFICLLVCSGVYTDFNTLSMLLMQSTKGYHGDAKYNVTELPLPFCQSVTTQKSKPSLADSQLVTVLTMCTGHRST